MNYKTKKIAMLGVLVALCFLSVLIINIPVVPLDFLKYEPKDVLLAITGFVFGPISAAIVSVIEAFFENILIDSNTIPFGFIMNVISSCSFACTAAVIYKRNHTLKGAIVGLIAGTVASTALMLLWNYLITPLYMTWTTREEIVKMLAPIFLPYNLLKCSANAALTMLVYKPVVNALRRAHLIESYEKGTTGTRNIGIILVSLLVLATCVLCVLVLRGVI